MKPSRTAHAEAVRGQAIVRYVNGGAVEHRNWRIPYVGPISSFGVGGDGEVYMIAHSGAVYKLVDGRR